MNCSAEAGENTLPYLLLGSSVVLFLRIFNPRYLVFRYGKNKLSYLVAFLVVLTLPNILLEIVHKRMEPTLTNCSTFIESEEYDWLAMNRSIKYLASNHSGTVTTWRKSFNDSDLSFNYKKFVASLSKLKQLGGNYTVLTLSYFPVILMGPVWICELIRFVEDNLDKLKILHGCIKYSCLSSMVFWAFDVGTDIQAGLDHRRTMIAHGAVSLFFLSY